MDKFNTKSTIEIMKKDDDRRLVFGWFNVCETWKVGEMEKAVPVLDLEEQPDVIPEDVLEDAGYQFVLNARVQGEMHLNKSVGRLVEHCVMTKAKQKLWGVDFGKSGIWGGFYVDDDDVWDSIKKGIYPAFSIGGQCIREPIPEK